MLKKINPRKQMLPGSIPAEHIQPCFMRSASQPDSKAGDLEEIIGQELCLGKPRTNSEKYLRETRSLW